MQRHTQTQSAFIAPQVQNSVDKGQRKSFPDAFRHIYHRKRTGTVHTTAYTLNNSKTKQSMSACLA